MIIDCDLCGDDADDEPSDHKARETKKDKSPPRKRRKRYAVSKQILKILQQNK